jgi:lysophospholipase L1-like esterase
MPRNCFFTLSFLSPKGNRIENKSCSSSYSIQILLASLWSLLFIEMAKKRWLFRTVHTLQYTFYGLMSQTQKACCKLETLPNYTICTCYRNIFCSIFILILISPIITLQAYSSNVMDRNFYQIKLDTIPHEDSIQDEFIYTEPVEWIFEQSKSTSPFATRPLDKDSLLKLYPFLKWEFSGLQLYQDSSRFHKLFAKIQRINSGSGEKLNIVHIGGSHVQAGIMSHRLRNHFRTLFDPSHQGERGFLFPYTLAKTNNPYDYTVTYTGEWVGCRNAVRSADCLWGVSGITASTHTPYSTVHITAKDPYSGVATFCSARVYYDMDRSSFKPEVINWDCPVYEEIDSLLGYIEWHFDTEQRSLEWRLSPTEDSIQYPFSLEGVHLKTDYPGIAYHAIGVNGASVPSYLRGEKFARQLCLLDPDLIIWGIGVNDANTTQKDFSVLRFEDHYDRLLERVCSCDREVAMIFLTNNDTFYKKKYANRNALSVRYVMNKLALRYGGGVFDQFGIMGELGSIQKWQQSGLAKRDLVHFTNDGYKLMGDLIFNAFLEQYINFASQNH